MTLCAPLVINPTLQMQGLFICYRDMILYLNGEQDSYRGKFLFRITKNIDRAQLILNVEKLGDDYLLALTGGKEHIGAVAVGLFDEMSQRSSSSVISLPGHRDEQIALEGSKLVSKITHKTTVFIAGIHLDNINAEEIRDIISVSREMVKSFINFYEKTKETSEQKK